jgi:hypothetical protein
MANSDQGMKPGVFKLWVNWIQLVQPHRGARPSTWRACPSDPIHRSFPRACDPPPRRAPQTFSRTRSRRTVAVQVLNFMKALKPGFHFMGSRVVSWRLKSEGQTGALAPSLDTSCTNCTANKTRPFHAFMGQPHATCTAPHRLSLIWSSRPARSPPAGPALSPRCPPIGSGTHVDPFETSKFNFETSFSRFVRSRVETRN